MFVSKLFYLFLIFNFYGHVISDDLKDEGLDSKAHSDRGGLWFGPRLGKRSMQTDDDGESNRQLLLKLLEIAEYLTFYYNQLPYDKMEEERAEPKARYRPVITPIPGRSLNELLHKKRPEHMVFTPRLGRRHSDDMPAMPSDADSFNQSQPEKSTYYFTPRLGRNNISFSPRLGRDLAYGIYPDRVRFVRSVKTNLS